MNKERGQITIFIIVAIMVIAIVALLFAFPKLKTAVGFEKLQSPENFIQTCLEDTINENVNIISKQGGTLEPSPYILYQDEKIQYLCYNPQKYQACVVQIPFLEKHIEDEIKKSIEDNVNFCFNSLKQTYEDRGYTTNLKKGEVIVELLPKRIITTMNYEFTFSKEEDIQKREIFRVIVNNNNLYELVAIAQSIMDWEILMGDSFEQNYMDFYTWLKVEKKRPGDDTTIYILTDRNTDDKFKFAIQSWILR
ncbi:MAG: hypothetical protein AABY06_00155 [Nanoarchaeota archaeon]